MSYKVLDDRHFVARTDQMVIATMHASGTAAVNTTVDNALLVDAGGGIVTVPSTAHGFKAGSHIGIGGSVSFDSIYELIAVTANNFNIYATFEAAYTFAGTETLRPELAPGCHFRALELRLHLDGASAAEDFITTLDAGLGEDFDVALDTKAMNALTDYVLDLYTLRKFFNSDDLLYWTYPNAGTNVWGLEVKYQLIDG